MKISKLILLLFAVVLMNPILAQDSTQVEKKWKFSGKPGVKWSRNSFSNWAAGGVGSTAIEFDSEAHAVYKYDGIVWKNDLEMSYGFNRRGNDGRQKIVDKFKFYSNYSWVGKNENFRYSVLLNVKSQFTEGYDYRSTNQWLLKSSFMAPGYFSLNVGVDYIGIERLNVHFSPISEKTTIVTESYYDEKVFNEASGGNPKLIDNSGVEPEQYEEGGEVIFVEEVFPPTEDQLDQAENNLIANNEVTYGLAWRENSRFETGYSLQMLYDYPGILKNVDFKTRLDIFSSYADLLKTPDVDWEVWLSFNFNKYLAFSINTQMIYDSDILFDDGMGGKKSKLQFRDFFGVGMTYTFKQR